MNEKSYKDDTAQYWEKQLPFRDEEKNPDAHLWSFMEKYKNEIGPKIIEIGAGTGPHLVPLTKMGYEVTGVELTAAGSAIVKQKLSEEQLPAQVVRADFRNLPFKNESFDTGFSIQALQHNNWEGAEQSFVEISRVLKPGGLFFFRAQSTENPRKGAQLVADGTEGTSITLRGPDKDKVIIHKYSLEELHQLADQNNLEILEAVDEQTQGSPEKGQWNVVLRKKTSEALKNSV